MTNNLYSKYYPIASKLKPSIASDIVSAAETITLLGGTGLGLMTGNFSTLIAVLGEQGVKKIAQQMLINPKFQQLAEKSVEAINQNKFSTAKKLYGQYKIEVSKISPESGKKLPEISEDDFKELSRQRQKP